MARVATAASNPAGSIASTLWKSAITVVHEKAGPGFPELTGRRREPKLGKKCGRPENQVREEFSSLGLNRASSTAKKGPYVIKL